MDNDLCNLPATSNCTNLSTLLLQRNKNLMMIQESFFLLRVLDLLPPSITSLPPSLPCLTHLRAVYLNSCEGLIELPSSIEALVHLEVLDIRRTGIISLPIQVGSLTQMRCLRMSLSYFGAGNPMSKVISSISSLKELMIDVDPNTLWSDQVMRTITEEVSTLTRLTSLTFSFSKDLRFTFQFSVGICNSVKHHILDYFEYQLCKCLKYANDEGTNPVISKNIPSLSNFGTKNLSKLRACSVEGCEDIICIIDGNVAPPCAFEWLERMFINNAPSLHCIWEGPQLSECHEIEEIIIENENPCLDPRTLPSLKKLVVHDLPKLRSIAPNDLLIWPSLERLDIASCPSLLKLPFTGINAINLRSIDAEQSWWSSLGWQDQAIEERLRSFCSFI
ncbi:hypothetical protein EUGRSUZ_G00109 [Eucalyptus grandis]|uniref:Uncharacterized protein n=2 Tax=Eucalyptus grandis TaxID=71139 RepID=A0ACC3JZP3_EUCGR|nr:hypothetical protein EUGRSUZ_G00109 [Eucalyptus grandis]